MGKNSKTIPARPPVKAKGTIPAPKVGYRAARKPWYKHGQTQLIMGLILLVVLGVAASQVVAWRHRVSDRAAEKKAVKMFDDKVTAVQNQIIDPLNGIQAIPSQFQNGQIKPDVYKDAAGKWLSAFQRMAADLRGASPPSQLAANRAHFVESAVLFVDAVRTYQLAAQTTEPPVRDQAILLAGREVNHATTAFTNALKELEAQKKRVGVSTGSLPTEPDLPQEDVNPAAGQSSSPAPPDSQPPATAPTSP